MLAFTDPDTESGTAPPTYDETVAELFSLLQRDEVPESVVISARRIFKSLNKIMTVVPQVCPALVATQPAICYQPSDILLEFVAAVRALDWPKVRLIEQSLPPFTDQDTKASQSASAVVEKVSVAACVLPGPKCDICGHLTRGFGASPHFPLSAPGQEFISIEVHSDGKSEHGFSLLYDSISALLPLVIANGEDFLVRHDVANCRIVLSRVPRVADGAINHDVSLANPDTKAGEDQRLIISGQTESAHPRAETMSIPTEEYPVAVQGTGSGGVRLGLYLPQGIGVQRFQRLASCKDLSSFLVDAIDRLPCQNTPAATKEPVAPETKAPYLTPPSNDPTAAHPVAYHSPNQNEYILSVFLREGIDVPRLQRLARCSDLAGLIRDAVDQLP